MTASNKEDLEMIVKALANANAVRESIKTDHQEDHEESIVSRNAVLKLIAGATKTLKDTSSRAVEQFFSLVELSAGQCAPADLKRSEVVNVVRQLAKKFHSSSLVQLASRSQAVECRGSTAGEGPFAKVTPS